jgi:uncharacterized membrane protein
MSAAEVLLLAFMIGVVSGLRSFTAPAIVSWAAYRGWFHLSGTHFSFMSSIAAVIILFLLAIGELIADPLPSTPSRTRPIGLIARIILGGLCGAILATVGGQSPSFGSLLGAAGGVAGAFAGRSLRVGLVQRLKVRDFIIALLEDAVAIAGGFLIVSRF